jgi:hypothetical protein
VRELNSVTQVLESLHECHLNLVLAHSFNECIHLLCFFLFYQKYKFLYIICRYIVIEVNAINVKHDAALILKPTSLYFSITKKIQQLHGDFGVAATKTGLAGKFIAIT